MGNIAGNNNWENNIYQFELSDLLLGGPDGIDNLPLKQLANRTMYLYERVGVIGKLNGVLELTNNSVLDASAFGKLIVGIKDAAVLTITLPKISTVIPGTAIPIMAVESGGVINVVAASGDSISFGGQQVTVMHVHNRERICVAAIGAVWVVCDYKGNFNCVGEEVKGRTRIGNTLVLDGSLINRDTKPRLWKFVNDLTGGSVTETQWQSALRYKGFFSTGNTTSNFRLPDERGMYERMIDLGRGIDNNRLDSNTGSYEPDLIKAHKHKYEGFGQYAEPQPIPVGSGDVVTNYFIFPNMYTETIGADENTVKNIGKLNLIKY